jgi:hypothetical protein
MIGDIAVITVHDIYRLFTVSLYQIKKLVIFVHFKGFNISQKPKSSPLSYFAQKTSLNLVPNFQITQIKKNAIKKII